MVNYEVSIIKLISFMEVKESMENIGEKLLRSYLKELKFENGFAKVYIDNKYGFINTTGEVIILIDDYGD